VAQKIIPRYKRGMFHVSRIKMKEEITGDGFRVTGTDLYRRLSDQPWIRSNPSRDTGVALLTVLYFIPSYYLGTNSGSWLAVMNFILATTIVLVVIPAYYMLKVLKEPLSEIGITKKQLIPSLGISLLMILRYLPILRTSLASIPDANVLPHLLYCGLCLWEPFFVHCWVQLRFEKAFGIIPGVFAAGICTALYHIGSFPIDMVLRLGFYGIFYGVLFRLTRNILVLWPFSWAGASAMGTIMGGFVFNWMHVKLYSVILLVQILCIWAFYLSERRNVINISGDVGVKSGKSMEYQDWVRACVYVPLMFYQFYLSWRFYNNLGLSWVANLGWLVLMVSGVFGWLPIFEFKRHGGVPEDQSYIMTTRLVDSGVYSVVRHPQFLAGVLICLSMMLISQHLYSVVAGLIAAITYAYEVVPADRRLVEKFGDPYQRYKERVPALNFVVGLFRLLRDR